MNIMIRKKILNTNLALLFLAFSQVTFAQDDTAVDSGVELQKYDKEVQTPFNSITEKRSTGSVIVIDVEKELQRDQGATVGAAINGKMPGIIGGTNTWGTGAAVILVDGIRQTDFFIQGTNLLEVESIVILKDALSKAMYGAKGDQGVILVTTKRGKAGEHKIRVTGNYTYAEPRALPNYLGAADYMEKYNEALLNDGLPLAYTQDQIDGTRSGTNPAMYPDNDFYSNDYIKDFTNSYNVLVDAQGGNENVKYYVNTGYTRNTGWLNTPTKDVTDRLNFRGNLDIKITDYLDLGVVAVGRMSFNERPNTPSIWNTAANELPNNYPMFIDPNIIPQEVWDRDILVDPVLANGMLLGGNSSFLNNVYGGFTQNGRIKDMNREAQFGIDLKLDMGFITEGLSAKVYGGMNFFNSLFQSQSADFTVFEPIFDVDGLVTEVVPHGSYTSSQRFSINSNNSTFFRQVSYYGTLNYDRSFGVHDISATAMLNGDQISTPGDIQKDVVFNSGFSANYMYDNKYIAEASLMGFGSRKLADDSRMEWAPSFGLGWVLSEEDFLADVDFVDYLKLRTSYGISKNDEWDNYFLYKSTFVREGGFNYNNGGVNNNLTQYDSAPNDISMQTRTDFSLGVDATLLNQKMNVMLGYFNSEASDLMTARSSTYPQIMGYNGLVMNNFNANVTRGLELGVNYNFDIASDLSLIAGVNLITLDRERTQVEEPVYEGVDAALTRLGTASDAMWALKSDGLYAESDFNLDGTLIDGLPVPSYGAVQAGDIKYLDQNDDGIIDQLDNRIVGHGLRTQYSFYFDLKYKKVELYALFVGTAGDSNFRTGDYFRVGEDNKYSDQALLAYGPNNKDVNAIHPRLSTVNNSNNNRNSDYWLYKNDTFTIPTIQLTYNFDGGDNLGFLKDSRVYVRSTNVAVFGDNTKYTEINIGGSPRTSTMTVGLIASF